MAAVCLCYRYSVLQAALGGMGAGVGCGGGTGLHAQPGQASAWAGGRATVGVAQELERSCQPAQEMHQKVQRWWCTRW